MILLAIVFLLIAVIAYVLKLDNIGGLAIDVAKLFLILFIVLLLFSALLGFIYPATYWHYPFGPRTVVVP